MNLFLDGQEHYNTALIGGVGGKWTTLDTTDATWTIAAEGRTTNCIKRVSTSVSTGTGQLGFTPLWTQAATWSAKTAGTFGAALKVDDLSTVEAGLSRPSVLEARGGLFSVYNGSWQMATVGINPNGTLTLYTISGSVTMANRATSVRALHDATWAFLEFQWLISTDVSTADGAFVIRANGNQILNYSGILFPATFPFPAPTRAWNSVSWMGTASTAGPPWLTMRSCDVYLNDNVASADPANPNDSFLGDGIIDVIQTDGVGAQSDWTPSSGANWQRVHDMPPNTGGNVTSTAVGDRDTYTYENITGDPKAIQVVFYVKKDDVSAASVAVITRQSGADEDGPNHGLASTDFVFELQPYDTNPHTNLQWTEAEINAGEWGPLKAV